MQGHSQLVHSQGEASCSGTPRHTLLGGARDRTSMKVLWILMKFRKGVFWPKPANYVGWLVFPLPWFADLSDFRIEEERAYLQSMALIFFQDESMLYTVSCTVLWIDSASIIWGYCLKITQPFVPTVSPMNWYRMNGRNQGHKTAEVNWASCWTLYQPSEHESPSNKW